MQGNLSRCGISYISPQNMYYFAEKLMDIDAKLGILITPYLIVNDDILYELHYYEFDVVVRGGKSYYVDYNPRNTLPAEILENLKPQVRIAIGDKNTYRKAVKWYLDNMSKMEFEEDKKYYPKLQDAQLYYQIFIDSD